MLGRCEPPHPNNLSRFGLRPGAQPYANNGQGRQLYERELPMVVEACGLGRCPPLHDWRRTQFEDGLEQWQTLTVTQLSGMALMLGLIFSFAAAAPRCCRSFEVKTGPLRGSTRDRSAGESPKWADSAPVLIL